MNKIEQIKEYLKPYENDLKIVKKAMLNVQNDFIRETLYQLEEELSDNIYQIKKELERELKRVEG